MGSLFFLLARLGWACVAGFVGSRHTVRSFPAFILAALFPVFGMLVAVATPRTPAAKAARERRRTERLEEKLRVEKLKAKVHDNPLEQRVRELEDVVLGMDDAKKKAIKDSRAEQEHKGDEQVSQQELKKGSGEGKEGVADTESDKKKADYTKAEAPRRRPGRKAAADVPEEPSQERRRGIGDAVARVGKGILGAMAFAFGDKAVEALDDDLPVRQKKSDSTMFMPLSSAKEFDGALRSVKDVHEMLGVVDGLEGFVQLDAASVEAFSQYLSPGYGYGYSVFVQKDAERNRSTVTLFRGRQPLFSMIRPDKGPGVMVTLRQDSLDHSSPFEHALSEAFSAGDVRALLDAVSDTEVYLDAYNIESLKNMVAMEKSASGDVWRDNMLTFVRKPDGGPVVIVEDGLSKVHRDALEMMLLDSGGTKLEVVSKSEAAARGLDRLGVDLVAGNMDGSVVKVSAERYAYSVVERSVVPVTELGDKVPVTGQYGVFKDFLDSVKPCFQVSEGNVLRDDVIYAKGLSLTVSADGDAVSLYQDGRMFGEVRYDPLAPSSVKVERKEGITGEQAELMGQVSSYDVSSVKRFAEALVEKLSGEDMVARRGICEALSAIERGDAVTQEQSQEEVESMKEGEYQGESPLGPVDEVEEYEEEEVEQEQGESQSKGVRL